MTKPIWYCPICFIEGTDEGVTRCPEDGTPVELVSTREAKWIGKTIDKKYKVVRFVGAGGMADVFEVEKLTTQKHLALKLLKSSLNRDSQLNSRFRQEAMMISLIAHRNIVAMEDFGVLEDNTSYMVMELLHGYTVGDALKMGPIPAETAFRIMLQACEGMAAAHERGVLHRDLKPENIFLHSTGGDGPPVVKILDLGIGKLFNNRTARGLTLSGMVIGTPQYMSPEQCKGHDAGVPSDIYSLGIVLYEMLFGCAPFDDESPLLILPRQISETPYWDDGLATRQHIPENAKPVILKALAKNPAERHETMLDLQKDISGLLSLVRRGPQYRFPSIEKVRRTVRHLEHKSTPSMVHSRTEPLMPVPDAATEDTGESRTITLEFTKGVYWVGRRHHTQLECNPYLRVFTGKGNTIAMLIDPGPPRDLDSITKNISSVIESVENLNYIYINHQDPDVAGNAAELQRTNPQVQVICSEDTWRMARHYGLDAKRYISLESIPGHRIGFSTGHHICFIPTPFCHARGAAMVYDPDSRVLFSGDLFAGASARDGYFFSDDDIDGIQLYHQVYMPSGRALRRALQRIAELNPAPRAIAPQHGNIISQKKIPVVMDALQKLRVGMDLIEYNEQKPEMLALANEVMRTISKVAGQKASRDLATRLKQDQHLKSQFEIRDPGEIVAFKIDSIRAIESLFHSAETLVSESKIPELMLTFNLIRKRMHQMYKS
ncbi:MAG: protein kinase [Deltaproteobacteria bacterium]|nr:protein kinase [Deltaproteobacteria bacterium]